MYAPFREWETFHSVSIDVVPVVCNDAALAIQLLLYKCFSLRSVFVSAVVVFCLCAAACGARREPSSRVPSKPASVPPSPSITGDYDGDDDYASHGSDGDNDDSSRPKDRDNDFDNPTHSYFDGDDSSVRGFGHAASAVDRRAITALVKRYYALADAEDGAAACPMIVPSLANSVVEALGGPGGPPFAHGKTCAEVMTSVFAHYHRQLAADTVTLRVSGVRVDGRVGVAVLAFRTLPGRQINVARMGAGWRIDILLDTELP